MAAGAVLKGAAVFETDVTSMFMSSSTLSDLSALVESSSATAGTVAKAHKSTVAAAGTPNVRRRGPARSLDCDVSSVIRLSLALSGYRRGTPFHELADRGIENSK